MNTNDTESFLHGIDCKWNYACNISSKFLVIELHVYSYESLTII